MRTAPAAYFGVGGGVAYTPFVNNDFNIAGLLNSSGQGGGGLSQQANADTTAFGWKAFIGYRLNPYFGVEGGYTDFGKTGYPTTYYQNGVQVGNADMSYKAASWYVAAVPRYPFPNGTFVQGKLGAAFTRTENSYGGVPPTVFVNSSDSKSRTNFLAGIGLGYDFPNGLSIIGEYEYYGRAGDTTTFNTTTGIQGTGRADLNLFSVSGLIRF